MSGICAGKVLVLIVLAVGISAKMAIAASGLPTNQQILAFLTETIDWYRHRGIEAQIANDPVDLAFVKENRPVAGQIVQLGFDFARAGAAMATTTANDKGYPATPSGGASPDVARFVELENSATLASQQASQEIEAIKQKLRTADGADRQTLQAALEATQSRLDLLHVNAASLRDMVAFVRGRQAGDLASSIDDLARTVPEVTSPTATPAQLPNAVAKPQDSSILGRSAAVSTLRSKLRLLDEAISQTDKLRQSSDALRTPLLAYVNNRFSVGADPSVAAGDLSALQAQKAQLDALKSMVKALAPAIVALDKQTVLLTAYASHLASWRAAVSRDVQNAWQGLLVRLLGLAGMIGTLLVAGAGVRRLTDRYVRDPARRHVFRVIARVAVWLTIVLVAAFSVASDWSSMAGIAVALQSVISAALGYFLLVGRRGIRIGDRVQLSGVTGDVAEIGWLQFRLKEIDAETQQPTGRVVTYLNSFMFASPQTGLSRLDREEVKPRADLARHANAP